jgi:hypothetical protein
MSVARFKIISRKEHRRSTSGMPKGSRSFVEMGFSALECVIEDTETGQRIEVDPIPFTADDPQHKKNVEKLALDAAAKAVAS